MKYTVLTLFPEQIQRFLETSMMGRAIKNGAFTLDTVQIRDFCGNAYGKVDDTMFGGGTGMLMQCEPVFAAWQSVIDASKDLDQRPHTIFLSPKGAVYNQQKAMDLARYSHLLFVCGHYEGIDQRVLDKIVDEEISIGDYVLTGGEVAACVVIDSVSRMLPGVLPDASAYENESHMDGLLEAPQYSRPETWQDRTVPSVLLSGHHAKIVEWRRVASLYETWKKRPDLMDRKAISSKDWELLLQWKEENEGKL